MAFISTIDKNDATGKLKEVYDDVLSNRGKLSNILQVHSLMPDALKSHMDLYMAVMFDNSSLSRKLKEMIAVVVSQLNKCEYCIKHHTEALSHYWKDEESLKIFLDDFTTADLEPKEKIVLFYAHSLTLLAAKGVEEIVTKLRQLGYTDKEILQINLIVSYFNFVNRVALGLGVKFTEDEVSGYKI